MATLSVSFPPFPRESPSAIPGEMGSSGSGGLVAASCIPDRDKPGGRFHNQTVVFTD